MIWGKTLDPGKLYTEVVHTDIHLSMAALESRTDRGADYNGYTQVMLKTEHAEFLLCTLVHGVIFQQHLDVQIRRGEEISVFTEGKNKVHLTGYSLCDDTMSGVGGQDHTEGSRQDEDEPITNQNDGYDTVLGFPDGMIETPPIKKEYPDPEEVFWTPIRPPGPFGIFPHLAADFMRWGDQRRLSQEQRSSGRLDPADVAMTSSAVSPDGHSVVKLTDAEERNSMPVSVFSHSRLHQGSSDDDGQYPSEEEDSQPLPGIGSPHPALRLLTSPPVIQRTQTAIRGRTPHRRKSEVTRHVPPYQNHTIKTSPPGSPRSGAATSTSSMQTQVIQRTHRPMDCSSLGDLPTQLPVPTPITGYQCHFCSKLFRNISNFKSHQLVHTNLKPFKCRFCGVGFKQTGNLKAHERIHTGDRPYKCSYCSKQFARSTTRNTHEKLHTGSVKYPCKLCEKVFMNASSLRNHGLVKHKTEQILQRGDGKVTNM